MALKTDDDDDDDDVVVAEGLRVAVAEDIVLELVEGDAVLAKFDICNVRGGMGGNSISGTTRFSKKGWRTAS